MGGTRGPSWEWKGLNAGQINSLEREVIMAPLMQLIKLAGQGVWECGSGGMKEQMPARQIRDEPEPWECLP